MTECRRGIWPVLAGVVVLCFATSAMADGRQSRTFARDGFAGPGDPRVWTAPAVDVSSLLAEDVVRRAAGEPYRVGLPHDVALSPLDHGVWETADDGGRVWKLEVRTPGALWTVLGFDVFRPLPGAELRVFDAGRQRVLGPYTIDDERADGQLWLPPVEGDTLFVELYWPQQHEVFVPQIRLGTVSHGYRPWGGTGDEDLPASPLAAGSCNVDVNCPLGDGIENQVRGVVKLFINGSIQCSGSLINNAALNCKQYVLTADHCYSGDGDAAGTMFIFNYEMPACEPGTVGEEQTLMGSTLRASFGPSDFRLLEIDLPIPAEFNVFFNGWSRSMTPATEGWTIHHPDGDVKKISHDDDAIVNGIAEGPDHWRVSNWEDGTTEPGSSGAPLFNQDKRIVGQLDVANASCANPSGFTEFGKVDVSWVNGLSSLLDPLSTGIGELAGMDSSFCGSPEPRLSHDSHVVVDGDDAKADPGETFILETRVLNDGPESATSVSGSITTTHPQVTLLDTAAMWPDISPFETPLSDAPHFGIELDSAFECGESVPLQLSLTSTEGVWQSDFLVATGTAYGVVQPPPFLDDVESGANGWTVTNLVGDNPWVQTTDEANSPDTSWHVDDLPGVRDSVLIMPAIASLPAGALLSFAHLMDSEAGDGGVLEMSTDGSSWFDAGERIVTGPYNSVISLLFSSPLAGRKAWTGDLGGWRTVEVDLSDLEGQSVTLRWRFASDTFSGAVGWYVDDVVLDGGAFVCCSESDGDGSCPAPDGEDCNDADSDVYPAAPQICDGKNNDCDDPAWPGLPSNETDGDSDGLTSCAGDCNGADAATRPGATEVCNGRDNDCDGLIDNDPSCNGTCEPPEGAGGETLIAAEPSASADPALVWTGEAYGIVWSDARDGDLEIYFRKLNALGQPSGPEVRVTTAASDSFNPAIVWTGTHYGVTWLDERGVGTEVYFARLDAAGAKIGGDVALGASGGSTLVTLAWSGTEFGVAWDDPSVEVVLARLDDAGNAIGTARRVSNGGGTTKLAFLTWTGSEYALAWQTVDGTGFNQIYFARVDPFGIHLGVDKPVTTSLAQSRRPSAVWTGAGFGVAWVEGTGANRTVQVARLDLAGTIVGSITDIAITGSGRPYLAWTGEEYAVAWRDGRDGNDETYFARIDTSGTQVGADLRLSDNPADSAPPAIVWTGVDFGVVWGETPDIKFTRVGCNCTDDDLDGWSACDDNCEGTHNPSQADLDSDAQGDHCDLDDGLIYLLLTSKDVIAWQDEVGFDEWNVYKGDIDVLRTTGVYTQVPGSNPLAARHCGLAAPSVADPSDPAAGKAAFFLVSGVIGGAEGGLGDDSSGTPRINENPCP